MPETAANSNSTGAIEVTALFTLIKCLRFKARFPNKKHVFRALPWKKSLSRILLVVMDIRRDANCRLDFCPTTLLIWAYIANLNKGSITPFARKTGFAVLSKHQIPPNLHRLLNCTAAFSVAEIIPNFPFCPCH